MAEEQSTEFTLLEEQAVEIGKIEIQRLNIFEDVTPEQRFRRWLNRVHTVTREHVIRSQLLFDTGSPVLSSEIEESKRLLRDTKYLHSADVEISNVENGVADLIVKTQDLWTLSPELDLSREGSETYYTVGIEEDNLFGTGASVTLSREKALDRTSNLLLYSNNNFLHRRINFTVGVGDSDDGHRFSVGIARPFFSLDSRWAAGVLLNDIKQTDTLYRNGDDVAEYRRDSQYFNLYRGWSTGRQSKWVKRFNLGFAGERSEFSASIDPSRDFGMPQDRTLYYPYISFDILEDDYKAVQNFRTMGRVEDVYLGAQYGLLLGYASEGLGSDRNALILGATTTHNIGSPDSSLLTIKSDTRTRLESGNFANFVHQLDVSWNLKQSDKWRFATSVSIVHTENADLDQQVVLGGSNDLRGYPVRYRNGRGRGILTIEQRHFSNWYPYKLFRIGSAIFFDAGQVWGSNVFGETNDDFLMDAGIGLRLASTKSGSKKVIHIDLATPLNADSSIDGWQLLIEAKQEF